MVTIGNIYDPYGLLEWVHCRVLLDCLVWVDCQVSYLNFKMYAEAQFQFHLPLPFQHYLWLANTIHKNPPIHSILDNINMILHP